MLFSEIYSAYYNAVAALINCALEGELNSKTAQKVICEKAFSESFVYILNSIEKEEWQILTKDYKTPIKRKPNMPLTDLQLRFLKSISLDKRFQLFCDIPLGLEDVEPLYTNEDFYQFDLIKDGDPYENEDYKQNFRMILKALHEHKKLMISYIGGKGRWHKSIFIPRKLEYSEKDDKFRLSCQENDRFFIINLARITNCEIKESFCPASIKPFIQKCLTVTLEIVDERNALERCMLAFADFAKETSQMGNKRYIMKLQYRKKDETEVLIRILAFGPMIKVIDPQSFIEKVKERILNQKKLRNN